MSYFRTFLVGTVTLAFQAEAHAKDADAFISIGIRQPLLELVVDNQGAEKSESSQEEKQIVIGPLVPTIGTVGVSYNHLSLGYSHNLDGENEDQLSYTDYRLRLFFSSFGLDASYSHFERFAITEISGFDSPLQERDHLRPEMSAAFYSANAYWFPIGLRYGLEDALQPNELKKSGIGMGLIFSYTQTEIQTPNGLVPEALGQAFGPDGSYGSGVFSSANLQAAFGFTLAPGPLYFSTMVAIGAGLQNFEYETGSETRSGEGIADKENLVLMAGYSAKRTFFALRYASETARYVLKHMTVAADSSDLSATFGVKF